MDYVSNLMHKGLALISKPVLSCWACQKDVVSKYNSTTEQSLKNNKKGTINIGFLLWFPEKSSSKEAPRAG